MDTHFTNQIQSLNPAQRAPTSQPNSSFQPEMNSRDQNDECSGSYSQISNTAPQNLRTGQAPLFEIPQEVNQQYRNVHGSCRDINHYSLLRKFNYIRQHNCYLEHLVKTKTTELNVFRENERHLKTQLGSLQQTNVSQVQEIQSLRQELQNLKNTTVSKHQYDEVFAQNQIIGANNIKLCDDNDELVKETTQVRLEKAELLIKNEKLQQDHDEANQNLKNEETKRIKVEKKLKDLTVTQAPSVVMLNEFKESVESYKVKISTLEKELTSLKEGNKSQVEQLEDELGGANAQIVQLNSQLQSSSEQFNFISDQSRELSAKVEQLNLENKILKANAAGLDKEKSEKNKLFIENGKLQQDLEEANKKQKNEENKIYNKTIEVETRCMNLTNINLQLEENLKNSEKRVENHQEKVKSLEAELTNLKESNNSHIENLNNELDRAMAQVIHLNLQLNGLSKKFKLSSDQNQKLLAKVKKLNADTKHRNTYVEGLEEENSVLQKFKDDTTSQTANELVSEYDYLKEEMENEKKRSFEQFNFISDQNQELSAKVEQLKSEKNKLFIENGKLHQDLEEANKKLKNEENKRIIVETRCTNLTNIERQLKENLKNSEKRVENHQVKVKSLEAELANLKESNNSHVEKLNNELDRAKAQIIHLNLQLNELSKEFKLSSDQNQKLSAKVKQLNADNKRRTTYVEGLEEENSVLQKFKDDTTSQTANELVSECDYLKEELENEKKRSSELNETVQKQSEEFKELNARYDEDKNELQRKSNGVSALEKLLEKVNDELQQEKTVVSRQKRQIEELELRINEAQKNNEEVSMIIESQDEENYAKTIVINQHKVLIASLKTQILQLKQNVKEKKMELDKEKEKNLKKQTEMDNLRKILKEMDSEIIQHDYIVQQLQTEIKQRDDEILTEKSANERLLCEKAELEAKLQSEVSARSSSMDTEHQSCLSHNLSLEELEVPQQRGHKPDHSEIADDNDSLRKRLRLA
ncbi:unnamed protein product [Orchesella dallaii]|uniref:Uncharacterized protein n=1 Tax=Orchesella dallaii TaxID=48710 RepID=A0ABP1RHW7_9HEXA